MKKMPYEKSPECCLKCVYRSREQFKEVVACEYLAITGHHRPCKGGDGCEVFREGERKKYKITAYGNQRLGREE